MKSKIFSRWLTLLIVLIHILYNNLYDIIVPNTALKIITDKYRSLFVPANYAFSIWGVIYIAILAYCVYQLLPSQKDKPFYDRINPPLMISMFLGMVWGIVFRESMITISMVVILFSFLTAYVCLMRVHKSYKNKEHGIWIIFPFSIYVGWLTAATFASLSLWLVYLDWHGGMIGDVYWTILLITAASLLGFAISFFYYDFFYALVIAWADFAIYIQRRNDSETTAIAALVFSVLFVLWSVYLMFQKKRK
jgi:hypothetical protein